MANTDNKNPKRPIQFRKVRFSNLPKSIREELKGFEDLIADEEFAEALVRRPKVPLKPEVELLTFLDNDQKRLDKAYQLLNRKQKMNQDYSQMQSLLSEQLQENDEIIRMLVDKITEPESNFLANLEQNFDKHFLSIET